MFVRAVLKSQPRAHYKLNAKFQKMFLQPREVLISQEGEAKMARVGARIGVKCTLLVMAHQLENTAETKRDAVFENSNRLRPKDFRVPARGLIEIAARHRDMGNVASRVCGNMSVVQ